MFNSPRDRATKIAEQARQRAAEIRNEQRLKVKHDELRVSKETENLLTPGVKPYISLEQMPQQPSNIFREIYDPIAKVILELSYLKSPQDAYQIVDSLGHAYDLRGLVRDIPVIREFIIKNGYSTFFNTNDVETLRRQFNTIIDKFYKENEKAQIEKEDQLLLPPEEKYREIIGYVKYLNNINDDELVNIVLNEIPQVGVKDYVNRHGVRKVFKIEGVKRDDLVDFLFFKKFGQSINVILKDYGLKHLLERRVPSKSIREGESKEVEFLERELVTPEKFKERYERISNEPIGHPKRKVGKLEKKRVKLLQEQMNALELLREAYRREPNAQKRKAIEKQMVDLEGLEEHLEEKEPSVEQSQEELEKRLKKIRGPELPEREQLVFEEPKPKLKLKIPKSSKKEEQKPPRYYGPKLSPASQLPNLSDNEIEELYDDLLGYLKGQKSYNGLITIYGKPTLDAAIRRIGNPKANSSDLGGKNVKAFANVVGLGKNKNGKAKTKFTKEAKKEVMQTIRNRIKQSTK